MSVDIADESSALSEIWLFNICWEVAIISYIRHNHLNVFVVECIVRTWRRGYNVKCDGSADYSECEYKLFVK